MIVNARQQDLFSLRENDPVYNGVVVKINPDSIVFRETSNGPVRESRVQREVVKKVNDSGRLSDFARRSGKALWFVPSSRTDQLSLKLANPGAVTGFLRCGRRNEDRGNFFKALGHGSGNRRAIRQGHGLRREES